jgi:hypothetical protein
VRELKNVVQRLVLTPMILSNPVLGKEGSGFEDMAGGQVLPLREVERVFRTRYFKYVRSISSSDSNAAEKLGLAPSNFYRMCKELGIK